MSIYGLYPAFANVLGILKCEVPTNELVFGVELESLKTNTKPLVDTGVGIWKEDCSCWGEFVTKPMTYQQIVEWATFAPLHTIKTSKECGMHVHINRGAITQQQSCRLALLLSDGEHAKDIDYLAGRKPTSYCDKVTAQTLGKCRYEVVNLTNFSVEKNTIELRLFSSTNDKKVFLARMLWVKKLVEFVQSPYASEKYSDFLAWERLSYSTESKFSLLGIVMQFMTKPRMVDPKDIVEVSLQSLRICLVCVMCLSLSLTPLALYIYIAHMNEAPMQD